MQTPQKPKSQAQRMGAVLDTIAKVRKARKPPQPPAENEPRSTWDPNAPPPSRDSDPASRISCSSPGVSPARRPLR